MIAVKIKVNGKEIAKEISVSDIYVHPARYEGFPNSLLEALGGGLCCIGTDSPGGVADILENGEFGENKKKMVQNT